MIDKMETIIYQTGVKEWKCILFEYKKSYYCHQEHIERRLISEDIFPNRFEAEAYARQTEDKLVYNLDPSDIR